MTLQKLDKMLGELDSQEDKELIEFYKRKRLELLEELVQKVKQKFPICEFINSELVDTIYKCSDYKTDVKFELEVLQVGSFKLQVERIEITDTSKLESIAFLKATIINLELILEDNGVLYRVESVPNSNFCLTRVLCGVNTGKTQAFQEEDLSSVNVFLNIGQY